MRSIIGFTLIEILIVMLIISIVSSVAVLTISHNEKSELHTFSKQLANLLRLAEEQALLQPAVLGFNFDDTSFAFYQFQENARDKNNQWQELTDSTLARHTIPKGISLNLKINGADVDNKPGQPKLIISNNGDVPAFVLLIGEKDHPPLYQIVGDEDGSIRSETVPLEN